MIDAESADPVVTHRREGFPGQRMRVLPRPLVRRALTLPVTRMLLVTDAGFYPRATRHGLSRPHGATETIVILCSSGRGTIEASGVHHTVSAGQVVVIPAGAAHRYLADADDPWTIWWLHLAGTAVEDLLQVRRAGQDAVSVVVDDVADPGRVVSLVDTVIRRMERDESMSGLVACSGAAMHALSLVVADRRIPSRTRVDPVELALEHLGDNVGQRISVSELAGLGGVSESHFSALFRRATGFSPLEYQTHQRMSRARELLDLTDQTVEQVALRVGYTDPLYFSRHFRRLHGTSPTEYRREHKG